MMRTVLAALALAAVLSAAAATAPEAAPEAAAAAPAAKGPAPADDASSVDESLHRMQRLHKEQQRLNRLQSDMNTRLQRIQAEFQRVAATQHDVNRRAHSLKLQEKFVEAEETANHQRSHNLRLALAALSGEQSRLMHDQIALQHLQQLLSMVGNPAYESLVPSMSEGMVVNPNLVDQLYGEDAKMGATLDVGRYTLEGRTRNERTGQEIEVHTRFALHTDGTVTGSSEYNPGAKGSHHVRIQLAGVWTPERVTWVEEFHNRAFLFNGTYSAADKKVAGVYEFPREGAEAPARGTFEHSIHRYRIPAGRGYLPPDFFKSEPSLDTPYRKSPINGSLLPGFYVVSGTSEDDRAHKTHDMPDMLFNLRADGTVSAKTAYLAAARASTGSNSGSSRTVVRMVGTWTAHDVSYVFLYNGLTFKFNGSLTAGTHGLQGEYHASRAVHSVAEGSAPPAAATGTFQFVMRRVVFEAKDHTLPMRFRALYGKADNLESPPLSSAPLGEVYNRYAGAAPSLAEVSAHGARVGAYVSAPPLSAMYA